MKGYSSAFSSIPTYIFFWGHRGITRYFSARVFVFAACGGEREVEGGGKKRRGKGGKGGFGYIPTFCFLVVVW